MFSQKMSVSEQYFHPWSANTLLSLCLQPTAYTGNEPNVANAWQISAVVVTSVVCL